MMAKTLIGVTMMRTEFIYILVCVGARVRVLCVLVCICSSVPVFKGAKAGDGKDADWRVELLKGIKICRR